MNTRLLSVAGWAALILALQISAAAAFTPCPKPEGYLTKTGGLDAMLLLPSVPAEGSAADTTDVTIFKLNQVSEKNTDGSDNPAWTEGLADADAYCAGALLGRFQDALSVNGAALDVTKLPSLIALMDRVEMDISASYEHAKNVFKRPRPFERFNGHVCAYPDVKGTYSYPSGHSAQGWAMGLVLAEIAPDKATAILDRARRYGDNRVVCGVHYPSDVNGGRIVATAVVQKLHTVAAFQKDFTCAHAEYQALVDPAAAIPNSCKRRP